MKAFQSMILCLFFKKKVDLANDFLAKHPPVEAISAMKNKRIKRYFEEGNSLEQIAVLVKLSEKEVSANDYYSPNSICYVRRPGKGNGCWLR